MQLQHPIGGPQLPQWAVPSVQGMGSSSKHIQKAAFGSYQVSCCNEHSSGKGSGLPLWFQVWQSSKSIASQGSSLQLWTLLPRIFSGASLLGMIDWVTAHMAWSPAPFSPSGPANHMVPIMWLVFLAWPVHILNHLISTNYLGSTVNNKGSLILGNSKAYEVTSQELGPKTHQILH